MPLKVSPPALLHAGDAPVYNRAGLAAWHAALANRTAAPAKVVWIGDSITEGVAATSYGWRWVDRALARLRQDHPVAGVAGGINYLPPYNVGMQSGGVPTGNPWTSKITANSFGMDGSWNLGGRAAVLNNDGDGFTYTVTCTSFQVMFQKNAGFGSLSISIDGGTATVVSAVGALGTYLWSSPALAAGSHTVTVTRAGGATVYFGGLIVFNGDEAAGVQGYEAGHYGWKASDVAGCLGGYGGAAIGLVAPQLAVIALGTNDYQAQVSIATFKANVQAIVASCRGTSSGLSIALLAYSRRGDLAAQPIGWDQYVRALYDLADADAGGINGASGVAVIDLSARLPNAATSGTVDALALYAADRVHYTPKGHLLIGEAVGRALGI